MDAEWRADKKTTENYLDSFENSVKKEFAGMLTTFKNKHRGLTKLKLGQNESTD